MPIPLSQRAIHLPSTAKSADDVAVAAELKLSSDEDAPMCMAVDARSSEAGTLILGINEADEKKAQDNEHLRIFSYKRGSSSGEDEKAKTT